MHNNAAGASWDRDEVRMGAFFNGYFDVEVYIRVGIKPTRINSTAFCFKIGALLGGEKEGGVFWNYWFACFNSDQ